MGEEQRNLEVEAGAMEGGRRLGDELRKSLARAKPTSIHLSTQHNVQPLDSLAHFEVTNVQASVRALVPSLSTI